MYFQNLRPNRELVIELKSGAYESHELHMHDTLEIHVLRENEANFVAADRKYDGKPGDVFLFRPFEPHWNLAKDQNKPIRWVSLLFSPSIVRAIPEGSRLLYPFYAVMAVSPYIPAASSCAQTVQELAYRAITEQEVQQVGWQARQFALFIDILVQLLRYSVEHSIPEMVELDTGIIAAIEHLLNHFMEELDRNELIAIAGKQRSYFYSKFKAVTGVTPNQFIHRMRMQVATHLLSSTDKPITDIAFECGYQSIPYFIKHFNQYRGMSPREYRKRASESKALDSRTSIH